MKKKIFTLTLFAIAFLACSTASAQKTKILSKLEAQKLERDEVAGPFPIFRAYEYNDNNGYYDLLLCEKKLKVKGKDTLNNQIEAICFLQDHGGYREQWSIKDQLDPGYDETSIWFWTKYCSATDLDGDKLIDPVVVYGTKDSDGEYRRIKIITVYKGKKVAIRAVEFVLDDSRSFKKDVQFESLPSKIKAYIEKLVIRLRAEQGVLLKNG